MKKFTIIGMIIVLGTMVVSGISPYLRIADLSGSLKQLIKRLVDLKKILSDNYYHPDFHGSYSIKDVLPVMVPGMGYDNMEIGNGQDASAVYAGMARGKYSSEEVVRIRESLKIYCELDTLAMVRLCGMLVGV